MNNNFYGCIFGLLLLFNYDVYKVGFYFLF